MSLRRWVATSVAIGAIIFMIGAGCPTNQTGGGGGGTGTGGDVAAGQAKFNSTCAGCHNAANLKGAVNLIQNNMGNVNPAMSGITLSNQDVLNLQAFISSQ